MNQTPTPPEPPVGALQPRLVVPDSQPQKNTIGLVALIAAIVGFIFACIPGALIMGWILLPVSFILAIVALAQKGKKKGMGVTALILSVVGTIVGIIVFLAVAVDAVSESLEEEFGQDDVTVVDDEPLAPEGDEPALDDVTDDDVTDNEPAEEPEAAGPAGTRDDPLPFDALIEDGDWAIELTGFNPDANAEVADGNMFNDEPADGTQWVTVEVAATYTGTESGNTIELTFAYVGSDGTVVRTSDALASGLEPDFDQIAELYEGGTEAGKIALLVPAPVDGLIRVTPSMFGDDVFVALP